MVKKPMNKDTIPDNFTLSLVIVDIIPVLFFFITIISFSMKTYFNYLFIIGGIICFISGFLKVIWKLIVVLKKKNVWWMFVQLRMAMPIGFTMITIGFMFGWKNYSNIIFNAPFMSKLFFTFWIIGMSLMSIFAMRLDSADLISNWIEQITNSISMIFLSISVIYL